MVIAVEDDPAMEELQHSSGGQISIQHGSGNVFLCFDHQYFGLRADQARELGRKLIQAAKLETH